MSEWKEYSGADEQIAEIKNAKNGFLFRYAWGNTSQIWEFDEANKQYIDNLMSGKEITHYWIIPDDPLREMKIRQAQTWQPVWIRKRSPIIEDKAGWIIGCTNTPNWNIPNAEYSFTPFENYPK